MVTHKKAVSYIKKNAVLNMLMARQGVTSQNWWFKQKYFSKKSSKDILIRFLEGIRFYLNFVSYKYNFIVGFYLVGFRRLDANLVFYRYLKMNSCWYIFSCHIKSISDYCQQNETKIVFSAICHKISILIMSEIKLKNLKWFVK